MLFLVCLLVVVDVVAPHGRLINPPARSCMWRYGFPTPKNYNDNALFCGGRSNQWDVNNGKCGICGDPYDEPFPRSHESGGEYATGTIAGYYSQGQVIHVQVEVTANHGGHFEFRLCPVTWYMNDASQECLDRYRLRLPNNKTQFTISAPIVSTNYTIKLQLPEGVICDKCVLQWKWVTANSWGCDNPDHCCTGCGPQEHFVNCADISIKPTGVPIPSKFSGLDQQYRPTALSRDQPTVLVTNEGQEILLPTVPKAAGGHPGYQVWMDDSLQVGIQPQGLDNPVLTSDRINPSLSSPPIPEQSRLYSASSSSFNLDLVQSSGQTESSDPHSGQEYSSTRNSDPQTGYDRGNSGYTSQSSGTQTNTQSDSPTSGFRSSSPQGNINQRQTEAQRPQEPALSAGITSRYGSLGLSMDVLKSLATIMENAKPVQCEPKYHVDGVHVECNRICLPSGDSCKARRQINVINAICKLLCTVVV